jgi:hypothetical protein
MRAARDVQRICEFKALLEQPQRCDYGRGVLPLQYKAADDSQ